MKKLVNDPADVIAEALLGVEAAHPEARVDHANKIIYRADAPIAGKVGLISGGGSGHEPLHGGFVGHGMLDAACVGEIFTSPVPDQMLEATKHVDGGAGVTVIVEKIAGAAAELGRPLPAVADVARMVNTNGRSMGMALTSCTVPAVGKPTFELGEDEMEIGVGIHGEPGRQRVPLASAREIAEMLVEPILSDLPYGRGDAVIAFVNGMGGTPLIELYLMYNEVARILAGHSVEIARSLVGPYITSLEMAGCSVTLVKLTEDILDLWDAPVRTPALRWGV
jgi:phosphoenolpyruvate---glycerone phosphotransferase subunit DhaK